MQKPWTSISDIGVVTLSGGHQRPEERAAKMDSNPLLLLTSRSLWLMFHKIREEADKYHFIPGGYNRSGNNRQTPQKVGLSPGPFSRARKGVGLATRVIVFASSIPGGDNGPVDPRRLHQFFRGFSSLEMPVQTQTTTANWPKAPGGGARWWWLHTTTTDAVRTQPHGGWRTKRHRPFRRQPCHTGGGRAQYYPVKVCWQRMK